MDSVNATHCILLARTVSYEMAKWDDFKTDVVFLTCSHHPVEWAGDSSSKYGALEIDFTSFSYICTTCDIMEGIYGVALMTILRRMRQEKNQ